MSRPLLALALPMLIIGSCLGSVVLLPDTEVAGASTCGPSGPGVAADLAGAAVQSIGGYSGEQLSNAAAIMNAGLVLGLNVRGQTIGVMTAMGESSLRVLDYGDLAGPDSRGLFQQRDNGAWGSYSDRMDPTISATSFFRALTSVDGWQTLPPTVAAHRTQRNADPYYYEQFWDPAVQVVTGLAGQEAAGPDGAGIAVGTGGLACTATTPGQITAQGWTAPALGRVTSNYGMRVNPVSGIYKLHPGTDIGAPCEAPIYAAAAGTVVAVSVSSGYGNLITVDHGGDVTTRYAHMYNNGLLTQIGATVTAGQQIARIGSNGNSTGCHLHYEVRIGGQFTDPAAFMTAKGSPLT